MIAGGIFTDPPRWGKVKLIISPQTAHDYWLVFNECEHNAQCDASPEDAADFYYNEVVRTISEWGGDPNAQLIIGGVNAHPCGLSWLTRFVQSYEERYGPLPHAGWHFHIYPEVAPSGWPNSCEGDWVWQLDLFRTPTPTGTPQAPLWPHWKQHTRNVLGFVWTFGEPDDEVWITEIGCLRNYWGEGTPTAACEIPGSMYHYTASMTEWLNNEGRWVNRYAWYTDWDTNQIWEQTRLFAVTRTPDPPPTPVPTPPTTANLSALGRFYSQVTPAAPIPLPWPTNFLYLPFIRSDD
jgi:hypothetical protein